MPETFHAIIVAKDWKFDAASDETVLKSAEKAGIRLASSCRNGTCRTCLCRLGAGTVHYQIEWPGLSTEEKRDGYILPCVAYPNSDLLIEEAAAMQAGPESTV